MLVAMEDALSTIKCNHAALELQRKCREKKADVLKELNLNKTKEDLLEATYYYKMYFSYACWKGNKKLVKQNLNKLKSKTAKLEALKENIRMRVKGCGFEEAHITWSFRRKQRSVNELAKKLEWVIEWEKDQEVPLEPRIELPQRRNDASLGSRTEEAEQLDEKFNKKSASIRVEVEKMRRAREARGEGCIYREMQPLVKPDMIDLLSRRIDVLFPFEVDSDDDGKDTVLRWCQGLVLKVYETSSKPLVSVEWDAMTDVDGSENSTISDVILLPTKWKKDVAMAWRMDVEGDADDGDVSDCDSIIESDSDEESDLESESERSEDLETESELEIESDVKNDNGDEDSDDSSMTE